MSLTLRLLCLTLLVAVVALAAGCTQLELTKPISWPWDQDEPGTPEKVMAMWKDTVLYQPNRPPTRGFGGRLMFYDSKDDQPIKVDGSLVVYAFDETNRGLHDVKPDRKFVFTSEQLAKHYSKSDLGHSYSVWLPWDPVGGEQKEISMIVRFLPKEGDLLVGKQARHLLPGRAPESAEGPMLAQGAGHPSNGTDSVRIVSYETPLSASHETQERFRERPRRMSTTTIAVPSQFGGRTPVAATQPPVNSQAENHPWAAGASMTAGSPPPGLPQSPVPAPQYPVPQYPVAQQNFPPAQAPPGWTVPNQPAPEQPQARFARPRSRPREESNARLRRDRAPWQQRPAESPFRRGQPPGPATGLGSAAMPPGGPAPFCPAAAPPPSWDIQRPLGG